MNTNKHQKQIIWQIYLPIILIIGMLIFSSFLLFGSSNSGKMDLRVWSDISILVLTFPLILSFVLTFIFLFFMISLVSRFKLSISKALIKISSFSAIISGWTKKLTNYITHPVILIESLFSQILSNKKE